MKSRGFVKRLTIKAIAFGLSAALAFSIFPNFNAIANATGGELELQKPILIVTGDELYTDSGNPTKEKSYTLSDLNKIKDVNGEYYSASKSKKTKTKSYFIANGVKVATLVGESIKSVEFIALSEYGKDKPFSLENKRYFYDYTGYDKYFEDQITANEYTKKEVPTIITWENASTFNETAYSGKTEANYPNELPKKDAIKEQGYLRTMCGQESETDANQSKFNGNDDDPLNTILVGKKIETPVLYVNEIEFTRAQLLMKDFAEREYSKNQLVRGVPISVLLKDIDDDFVVEFQCVDGYDATESTMTVKELKERNFMLGYEVNGAPIFGTSNNNSCGYLTLYGDNSTPVNMINKITASEAEQLPIIDDENDDADKEMDNSDDSDKPEKTDNENIDDTVKSGDESNMIPFMAMMIAAIICAAGTVLYRRKKTN